ncbi:TatD family hydrolase [archaeon]|jgi:TatD DNase family protein|nr:TatD family hydrolase [archaeon]MBT3720853.1 TatD family hydrolase [archaeon]MBT4023158.1 TatD family hydrolase [archaeon]MBT4272364.1 TatD family hydrolase [archaeon]MBT4460727.1 TatD family hydrolase [archaeon]
MKLIDVHCHLDNFFYKNDIEKIIKNCKKNNCIVIPAGITPDTNRQVLELKEKYPEIIFPTLGMYPPDALSKDKESNSNLEINYDIDEELKFIEQNADKIVGIGEVGMDGKDGIDLEKQEIIFRKTIQLAIKLEKPLVIHSRKTESKVIEILEEYNYRKIVMHCFGGNHKLVEKIRQNQWMFSIPTNAVRDGHFQKIIKETPIHLLLTETDSPFLSPFKEQKNEPINVIETIKIISKIKRLPIEDVANIIYRNATKTFTFN